MKKYAEVSDEQFPILKVTFTGEESTDENFQAYLDDVKDSYRSEKMGIIFDATNAALPSMKHQKMQADWLKVNESLMKNYCVGTAYVIPSVVVRTILKAIFAFQTQPVPYLVVKSVEDGEEWVNSMF
ncbi:MAG: STAS/SEC14 domain-containing protein [Bacteroidota bacterium]